MRHPRNALILCALYVFFIGCQSAKESSYAAADISSYRGKKISALTLKNGEIYKYDKAGGVYIEEKRDSGYVKEIVGFDPAGVSLNFELSKILEVRCQLTNPDTGGSVLTILLTMAATALILGLILAATNSRTIVAF